MRSKTAYLCLALALLLSLAACKGQADEQDTQPPVTPTVAPTQEPTPTPTPPIPYTDVSEDADYYNAVVWAYKKGIASDGKTFEPDSACTRGQVITFLWRAMGSPEPQITECPISDVAPSNWFYKPVLWAYESGISTSSTFNPGNPCSNGEVLTFLWRAEDKPAAAVHNSPVALAASGAYYERPAAWAETNGMLDFGLDPSAPCSRADLMMYLQWLTEEWTFAEEDKALQAEYEQIINDAQLYEVHGSGLVYADYVDVDNDGKVELLTVAVDEGKSKATAAVYANLDGHAKKASETSFEMSIARIESYFSLCKADGQLYLSAEGLYTEAAGAYQRNTSRFYRLGKDAIVLEHDLADIEEFSFETEATSYTYTDSDKEISEGEFKAVLQKFTDKKQLYSLDTYSGMIISISDHGLLPDPTAEKQKIYAAVKNGDFSAFAGNYGAFTLNEDGSITSNSPEFTTNRKPISVTITEEGRISCVVIEKNWDDAKESYTICPIGLGYESFYSSQIGEDTPLDKSKVQIFYTWRYSESYNSFGYCKVS